MSNTCDLVAEAEVDVGVTPAPQNISIVRETDNTFEVVLTDGNGEPVDITGDTVIFTVRDKLGGLVKIQISNAPGMHKDPGNGVTEFSVTKADTSSTSTLHWTYWVFEVRRVLAVSLEERVHIQGDFVVYPSVGGIDGD